MATVPTPDQTSLKILAIFIYFLRRPGEALPLESIMVVWKERGLDHADLKPGLDYAQEQGWIEMFNNGNSVRLTKKGFAQA